MIEQTIHTTTLNQDKYLSSFPLFFYRESTKNCSRKKKEKFQHEYRRKRTIEYVRT